MFRKASLLVLGLSILVPAAGASAQTPNRLMDRLREIAESGGQIRILDKELRTTEGLLTSATESTLTLQVGASVHEVPAADVWVVRRPGDSIWNGILIGAAIGAAVGFATHTDGCEPGDRRFDCTSNLASTRGGETAAGAALFGLFGLVFDASKKGWTTVYRAPRSPATAQTGTAIKVSSACSSQHGAGLGSGSTLRHVGAFVSVRF